MGMLDKLKNAAKSAVDSASKIAESASQRNDAEYVEGVNCGGIISGADLPKKDGTTLWYGIDNSEIVVCERIQRMTGTKLKLVKKYSLDDIAEFKHIKMETNSTPSFTVNSYYNELVLTSGDTLNIYNRMEHAAIDSAFSLTKEIDEWRAFEDLILCFIKKAKDEHTKQWFNHFFVEEGGSTPFDENGEINMSDFYKMLDMLTQSKQNNWLERKKSL